MAVTPAGPRFRAPLNASSEGSETAAQRLVQVVVGAGVLGLTDCAGIAGLGSDLAATLSLRSAAPPG